MGLSSALASAMSGLRANQAALSIVSSNVANSQTPGYVVQTPNQIEVTTGDFGSTAMTTGVSRELDTYVLNQLRTETGGSGYADQMANILKQLQNVYGTPGNSGTLETALNKFTTALQALSTSSGASSAQTRCVGAAQALAKQLNVTTKGIQSLRSNVEQDLGTSAQAANAAMQPDRRHQHQASGPASTDPSAATLMDQRDQAINTLSKYVDVRVTTDGTNQANIYTTTGIQLVGARARLAIHLRFGRRAVGDLALQHRSGQVRRRRDQHQAAERLDGRRRRQQRRSPPARSRPI